ncbi:hypothetical protein K4K49_001255 [Colletotrichum sp. SAR 10_70]|nr:hypothetical protein K4K49_001255 [Colletotrichum sp. SAR 10_70]KAI8200089.1 hypothetical protein K4K52_008471 [Colletotrichum sp. SAR 10_76]KAI8218822.1 hypothetical protein K4K53_008569 [Colletotrichum sp. SAR 10_77]
MSDALVRKAVHGKQSSRAAEWITAIFDGDLTAASALILAQCEQLESLTVDNEFARLGAKWLTALFRNGLAAVKDDPRPPTLGNFTKLGVTCYHRWDISLHWDHIPKELFMLSLSLYLDSFIPESYVQDTTVLRQALRHVRSTLLRLTVKYKISDEDYPDAVNLSVLVKGSLDSLRDLEVLEELNISLCVFYGQDRDLEALPPLSEGMPPKLKRLTINDSLWGFVAFEECPSQVYVPLLGPFLGGGWKTGTPELQEFALDAGRIRDEYGGEFARGMRRLRNVCEEQGLKCSLPGHIDLDSDDEEEEGDDDDDSLYEWI